MKTLLPLALIGAVLASPAAALEPLSQEKYINDRLIAARICSEDDDVMLTTRLGRAIRFPAPDVRVFKGRDSTGVRGIRLATGDEVVSMAVIRHFEASAE